MKLELGLTDFERRQRDLQRKARNCGIAILLIIAVVGAFAVQC